MMLFARDTSQPDTSSDARLEQPRNSPDRSSAEDTSQRDTSSVLRSGQSANI